MGFTPVYSAHRGDPCCNAVGLTSSVCDMAYRWNLDYVTDVLGNVAYYYKQDTNKGMDVLAAAWPATRTIYGRNQGAANDNYIRDSYLDPVESSAV